jgi:hypothetical protein
MTIRIIEQVFEPKDSTWEVLVEMFGRKHACVVHSPFTAVEESVLEWYFEQYIRFPIIDSVKAREVASLISRYGEDLFQQIFSHPYLEDAAELAGEDVEVIGGSKFQSLHWETLKDPSSSLVLGLDANLIRRPIAPSLANTGVDSEDKSPINIEASWTNDSSSTSQFNVLLVTSRPFGSKDVNCRLIARPLFQIFNALRLEHKADVHLDIVRPGTFESFETQLATKHSIGTQYDVVHFDMHGKLVGQGERET